jgi:hypothetical protein
VRPVQVRRPAGQYTGPQFNNNALVHRVPGKTDDGYR